MKNNIEACEKNVNVSDLGIKISGAKADFKCWAPLASDVKLLLFISSSELSEPAKVFDMKAVDYGVWALENVEISGFNYYKFRITNNGVTRDVSDIWSKCCSADSVASQIVDINQGTQYGSVKSYVNPFGNSGKEQKKYSDAVIYEIHVRDWSRAFNPSSTGKFDDLTEAVKNSGAFAKHLKDLGITHVQLLPVFDYAETNSDPSYNWGYNPYHYNVPEGRYVNNMTDGMDAVAQMRRMIEAFHSEGIAVNMDVVYNHTNGTGDGSLYDMTVPKYFYNTKEDGSYFDGSGCGNEFTTKKEVAKKYVISSLKHWMLDYHVNGFRFDLMGCLEGPVMSEIYDELKKIDPNVMIYGEPWTGGESGATEGTVAARQNVAVFDDSFRDAIKGKEFGGFQKGQVQGNFNDQDICTGLVSGKTPRNNTGNRNFAIHYVECHDNYTLFDKLSCSMNMTSGKSDWRSYEDLSDFEKDLIKKQDALAAAYILLSQGTVFINGGQEFMRTKHGDENSYVSSDTINQIDLGLKNKFSQIYNTYRGLLKFRKANPGDFGDSEAVAVTISEGFTKYTTANYEIWFNAGENWQEISDVSGRIVKIDSADSSEKGFTIENQKVQKLAIEPHSFSIILKN